jgi:hypothetical protein
MNAVLVSITNAYKLVAAVVSSWTNSATTSVYAGAVGTPGTQAGTGGGARFNAPRDIAFASDGNFYAGCQSSGSIFKITSPGAVVTLVTTGSGHADGTGTNATCAIPQGFCADNSGNVYFTDTGNSSIRKLNVYTSVITTLAGGGATGVATGNTDGTGTNALFTNPIGICIDTSNNILYISDTGTGRIRSLNLSNNTTSLLAGTVPGSIINGVGTNARFSGPSGIAYSNGNLYIMDRNNNSIRKIVISSATATTLAGGLGGTTSGHADGVGTNATFNAPRGCKLFPDGNLYVGDYNNNLIRKVTLSGVVTTFAGGGATGIAAGSTDGTGTNALFSGPTGVATDPNGSGTIYLCDSVNNVIRKIV